MFDPASTSCCRSRSWRDSRSTCRAFPTRRPCCAGLARAACRRWRRTSRRRRSLFRGRPRRAGSTAQPDWTTADSAITGAAHAGTRILTAKVAGFARRNVSTDSPRRGNWLCCATVTRWPPSSRVVDDVSNVLTSKASWLARYADCGTSAIPRGPLEWQQVMPLS